MRTGITVNGKEVQGTLPTRHMLLDVYVKDKEPQEFEQLMLTTLPLPQPPTSMMAAECQWSNSYSCYR